jgi:hypothetical protein
MKPTATLNEDLLLWSPAVAEQRLLRPDVFRPQFEAQGLDNELRDLLLAGRVRLGGGHGTPEMHTFR